MRFVLLSSTVVLAVVLEMNAVPLFKTARFDSEVTASQLTGPTQDIAPGSEPATRDGSDDRSIAAQVASLGKSDRLFVVKATPDADEVAAAASDGGIDDGAAIAAPPVQLTTGEFCEALADAAEASDIPVAFFARLIWQESKFKHDAQSQVGAQGVAQFMPRTAQEMGLDDPFDPRKALPASAKFLRKLHDQFGNLGLAAAAYNAGSGRIQNWLARRGPLPDETRNYVRKITGNPAETWTSEKKTAVLQQDLPREAPCEGVGGLSRTKETARMAVELTPGISGIIRKAEAEAARIASAAKAKARLLLAKAGKTKAAAPTVVAANDDKTDKPTTKTTVIITVTKTAGATKIAALGRVRAKVAKAATTQADSRIKVASAK